VPGFVVRRAKTSVDLKSGQSFMIGGLLQTQNNTTTQALPGLGKLPILGALFSSKAYQRHETDLVIIVTPYLVKPIDPSKRVASPLDGSRPASNVDYFLGNADEVKRGTPQFVAAGGPIARADSGHFLDLR
jgi:pilus assembly protein CpaC